MVSPIRKITFLAFAGFVLFAAGCGSANKGKIVGKWKLVSAPGMEEQGKMMEMMKAYIYFEFKADNTIAVGLEITDPQMKEMFKGEGGTVVASGSYTLKTGNKVEMNITGKDKKGGTGLFKNEKTLVEIKIDGDNMTITGSDGTGTLTRVK
jgi:hypothetical protein